MRSLPLLAIVLGLAGLLPFVACGLAALALEGEGARLGLLGLVAYGAVILAFLGAVHWGLGLADAATQPPRVQRARLGLGVLPALIGWAALLVTFLGLPKTGLLVLVGGFAATTVVEARGARLGLVPGGYMGLRWLLSVLVVVCLVSVTTVLAFGGRIVL